jgi:hypothetical protein
MDSVKYIGMDVHKEAISIAVLNSSGKLVMECIIETKVSTILQFFQGLSGSLHVTFEEGAWAAWLYDLLKPRVTELAGRPVVGSRTTLGGARRLLRSCRATPSDSAVHRPASPRMESPSFGRSPSADS